jgi:hypothetical protein
MTSRHKTEAGF